MKHRSRIVPRDQQRLTRFSFYEVRVVGNDRCDLAVDSLLAAIRIHPGAGAFARARVRIEIPQSNMLLSSFVGHLPNAYVGMSDGNVGRRREVKVESFSCDPEDAFA